MDSKVEVMPSFDPRISTTNDVVRQAMCQCGLGRFATGRLHLIKRQADVLCNEGMGVRLRRSYH